MEVEFNWKRLFLFGALLILAVALFVIWSVAPGMLFAKNAKTPTTMPASSATQQIVVSDVDINIDNQSSWKVEGVDECLPKLQTWLGDYPLESLTVVFTDTVTPDMAVSAVFPDPQESWPPDYSVRGQCDEVASGKLTCTIGVEKGNQGKVLDMLTTVEVAQLVADYYRPRTKEAAKNWTKNWKWKNFEPLIKKENDEWTSQCLHVKH